MINALTEFIPIYIQVLENKILIRRVDDSPKSVILDAVEQFSSKRLVVAEFEPAVSLLTQGFIKTLGKPGLFKRKSKVVIHQKNEFHEPLCGVEKQLLKELAFSVEGIHDVVVWEGKELTDNEVRNQIKNI